MPRLRNSGGSIAVVDDATAGLLLQNPREWKVVEQQVEIPDGEPAAAWTVAQLKAYAEVNGADLGDAKVKDEILAALTPPQA